MAHEMGQQGDAVQSPRGSELGEKGAERVKGAKSVHRVVWGSCLDYKVVVAVDAGSFDGWSKDKFVPEEKFLETVCKICAVRKFSVRWGRYGYYM
ncbi:hypothetical protein AAMO2058_000713600 [Amorphochlora amoebiformis]